MFSKRKGGSGKRGGGRRTRVQNGRRTTKEVKNEGNNGGRPAKKTVNDGGKKGRNPQHVENSSSDTSGRSNAKPQKRRRKKWFVSLKEKKDKVKTPEVVFKRKAHRNKSRRGVNPKRGVSYGRKNLANSDSSGSYSNLPSTGALTGYNQSSKPTDVRRITRVENDQLPWANLDMPMDLSFIRLEVDQCGVDFDLQARKNHQRWLANLEKVRVGSVQG